MLIYKKHTKENTKDSSNPSVKAKHEKKSMIIVPYAIVKPWTVMIHFKYTFITNRAMMSSWWLWTHTFFAYRYHFS